MRLTTVLLIATIMQLSAASLAQKVTLTEKKASLKSIFREIRKQTSYDFICTDELFRTAKPVDIQVKATELNDVLKQLFEDQPLTYTIDEKTIVVKEKEPSFLEHLIARFTAIDVRGRVLDETGNPLTGASVRLKGSDKSAHTNARGEFSLAGVQTGAVVVVTYVGYLNREVTVTDGNAGSLEIVMSVDVSSLSEVAVVSTGYQTIAKERSAGSFTQVNMEVVANRTTSMNVLQSLDGLVPGLVVNNVPNRSQILIRGLSTTGGTTGTGTTSQPLYVVDGLAMPKIDGGDNLPDMILGINPQDIESITVLKDATAASIWGARASNGVIVIKTKSGKLNSKLRVNYSGFVNFQGKPDLGYNNLLSPSQFVETGKEIFNTPGYLPQYPYATVSALNGGGITPLELLLYNPKGRTAEQQAFSLDSLAGLDNRGQIKDLFYRDALLSNHTASISGGGDKYAFYASTSYTNLVSNIPGEKNENIKINLRQDLKVNKNLSFYVISDLSNNNGSKKRNLEIGSAPVDYFFTPYQMFRDVNGSNLSIPFMTNMSNEILADAQSRGRISLDYNPLDEFNYGSTKSDGLLARLNGGVKLNIIKGLTFDGTYGYIKGKNKIRDIESQQSYTLRREVLTFAVAANPTIVPKYYLPATGSRMTTINGDQHKWDIRNQLTYDNTFGKHEITLLAGQEAQEQFNAALQTRIRGFDETLLTPGIADYVAIASLVQGTILPNLSTIGSSMINDTFSTNETTTRFTSYYANLSYTFDRKYALNGSWRIDQSNLFGKDKSAQNKPIWSAGARWNISNEEFMKPVNWVQNLALRLTYGLTGNSPEVGVASSRDITRPSGSPFFPGSIGMLIVTPGNPQLSWESTKTLNAGLDFSVLNGRLSAGIDVYQKKTTDLLGLIYPNSLTGFPTGIVGNQGDITNKGIEVGLSSTNVKSKDFSWSTNWNFAHNKSMVDKITVATIVTTGAQQVVANVREGYPAYTVFAYKYGGLDNTGAPQAILADGSVTKARLGTKPEDIVYMGTMQPVWNGGLTNDFQYKDFRLSANIIYNMGHVMRRQRNLTYGGQLRRNVSADFLDRWKVTGDETRTNIPGYITNSNPNSVAGTYNTDYFTMGDVNVVSASFVKLRDITLFYDLPKFLVNKIKAQGVTFRAQLSNVMLWKANKYGIDPEFQGVVAPSNQNTVTIGANVSF
ncbi:MAG TPA: SusC/RagA family TonB-linked outer membrane protein [Pedobacter sp.]|uniref:SusC/RagA family TonB-linked outer membrane protein n=1 Tax=Pedobacter sp. TaxID=1411316 RepID=UPI002CEED263|nr:SusC/RagA family TonB-linked outer membrane protein [Pedobacter sp.]HMI01065.1 SusC/RagA family TonB-linked outer membrane protein [Pedobacter sp.]